MSPVSLGRENSLHDYCIEDRDKVKKGLLFVISGVSDWVCSPPNDHRKDDSVPNNSLLMSDDYCEIENTGVYQTINVLEINSNTSLNIYVTQAAATAGAGNVLVSVVDGPVVDGGTINYGTGVIALLIQLQIPMDIIISMLL